MPEEEGTPDQPLAGPNAQEAPARNGAPAAESWALRLLISLGFAKYLETLLKGRSPLWLFLAFVIVCFAVVAGDLLFEVSSRLRSAWAEPLTAWIKGWLVRTIRERPGGSPIRQGWPDRLSSLRLGRLAVGRWIAVSICVLSQAVVWMVLGILFNFKGNVPLVIALVMVAAIVAAPLAVRFARALPPEGSPSRLTLLLLGMSVAMTFWLVLDYVAPP